MKHKQDKKILVTGGNGLVGSQIIADIKIGSEINLLIPENINQLLQTTKPSHVIHCAAKVGGLGSNMESNGTYFHDNIIMNTNLIESCRINNVEKLLCFLSTCIFPDNVQYPLTENKIHLGEPHFSNFGYAYAKRMTDIQIRAYKEQYGLNYVSVIPTNIYGPNDNFSLLHGHVIPMLIHKMYISQKNKQDFIVWGTGKAKREFIFSKDIAKLTTWALENYNESEPIIFSDSQEISISELVDILVSIFNFKGKVVFDESKPDGQLRKPTDTTKLKNYIPNFEFIKIEKGLTETVEWFIKNYENVRK